MNVIDSSTPSTGVASADRRLVRGGSYNYGADKCRVYDRSVTNGPDGRWVNSGARILRNIE